MGIPFENDALVLANDESITKCFYYTYRVQIKLQYSKLLYLDQNEEFTCCCCALCAFSC